MSHEEKLDAILSTVSELKVETAKTLVHLEVHKAAIDSHGSKIDDLIAIKNKGIGIAIIGGTGLGAFFSWLFKHS